MSETQMSEGAAPAPTWTAMLRRALAEERQRTPTDAELDEAQRQVETNPVVARALVAGVAELAATDAQMAAALRTFVFSLLYEQIEDLMDQDDRFTLHCGQVMLGALETAAQESL